MNSSANPLLVARLLYLGSGIRLVIGERQKVRGQAARA
jgi:hypothetical protein